MVDGYLYYLKIDEFKKDEWIDGKFYKIGITKDFNKKRKNAIICDAKRFNQIIRITPIIIKDCTIYEAFLMEQRILDENKEFRIYRNWSTELFSKDIIDNIKHYFEESFVIDESPSPIETSHQIETNSPIEPLYQIETDPSPIELSPKIEINDIIETSTKHNYKLDDDNDNNDDVIKESEEIYSQI